MSKPKTETITFNPEKEPRMFSAEIDNFKQYWPAHLFIHGAVGRLRHGFLSCPVFEDWGLGPNLSDRCNHV